MLWAFHPVCVHSSSNETKKKFSPFNSKVESFISGFINLDSALTPIIKKHVRWWRQNFLNRDFFHKMIWRVVPSKKSEIVKNLQKPTFVVNQSYLW